MSRRVTIEFEVDWVETAGEEEDEDMLSRSPKQPLMCDSDGDG